MTQPAVDQPDMHTTLNEVNRLFIDQLLGNLFASQERVKRTQWRRFMGKAVGISLPPMDPALNSGISRETTNEIAASIENSRYG